MEGIYNYICEQLKTDIPSAQRLRNTLNYIKEATESRRIYLVSETEDRLLEIFKLFSYRKSKLEPLVLRGMRSGKLVHFRNATFRGNTVNIMWIPCGEYRLMLINTARPRDSFKNFGCIGGLLDILAHKYKSNDTIESSAKNLLMANISHELRTPLNSIIGYTSILEYSDLDSTQRESVEQMRQASYNLLRIINDVIDINKLESNRMEIRLAPTNLVELIDSSYVLSRGDQARNVSYSNNIDAKIPEYIITDEVRLKQVLINLLSNAFKFTEIGYVRLRVTISDVQDLSSEGSGSDTNMNESGMLYYLKFSVYDSGIGIKEMDMSKLFKSFSQIDNGSTKKYKGTGLGLAISSEIVKLLGGNLTVQSVWNEGSRFSFIIPVHEHKSNCKSMDLSRLSQIYALIVSDNPDTEMLTNVFDKYNIEYRECSNIARASRSYLNNSKYKFTVCIIDSKLHNSKQLAESIFKSKNPISIIVIDKPSWEYYDCILRLPYDEYEIIDAVYRTYRPLEPANPTNLSRRKISQSPIVLSPKKNSINKNTTILIVEDNDANSCMLVEMLRQMGYYNIKVAESGSIAIDAVKASAEESCTYDVILMDVTMPGMSGIVATQHIRGTLDNYGLPHPIIIATTANVMPGDRELCLTVMDYYLAKPLDRGELQDLLDGI